MFFLFLLALQKPLRRLNQGLRNSATVQVAASRSENRNVAGVIDVGPHGPARGVKPWVRAPSPGRGSSPRGGVSTISEGDTSFNFHNTISFLSKH